MFFTQNVRVTVKGTTKKFDFFPRAIDFKASLPIDKNIDKYFFRPIGAFLFTQTQSDQNPHTKWALFSTSSSTFLLIGGD